MINDLVDVLVSFVVARVYATHFPHVVSDDPDPPTPPQYASAAVSIVGVVFPMLNSVSAVCAHLHLKPLAPVVTPTASGGVVVEKVSYVQYITTHDARQREYRRYTFPQTLYLDNAVAYAASPQTLTQTVQWW